MKLLVFVLSFITATVSAQPKTAETQNIYDRIYSQLCNCFETSSLADSVKRKEYCYRLVLIRNYDELKKYGVDTLANKDFKRYYDLYLKRYSGKKNADHPNIKNKPSNDDSFLGSLVDQQKLSTGEYEITLRSGTSNTVRKFISSQPVDQKELNRFLPGEAHIIIAYGTIRENGKEKYIVKSIAYIQKEKSGK
jgi:hypothetical protein